VLPGHAGGRRPETARFLRFDAVGRFLHGVADAGPVLVVLDDLRAPLGEAPPAWSL
jgi:hypothetical protein